MSHYAGRAMRQVCAVAGRLFTISSATLLVWLVAAPPVQAQSLPPGWTGTDIGSPAVRGRAMASGSTFTVEGGGTAVSGTSDQFYYVHQRITGDATIVARVTSLENTGTWAKAGLMIRESLAANSRHAFVMLTPSNGIAYHKRGSTGGNTTAGTGASGTAPVWLRLVRAGSTFTAARSMDGSSWSTLTSTTVSMGSTVYVGLAVSANNSTSAATAVFANVGVTTPSQLPAGWDGTDIGNPAVGGGVTYSNGTFSVRGGGADIWGTADQFGFVYRQVSGDVDVVARVASLSGPDAWSKAGVMIRTSLAASSAHASLFASTSNGIAFQRRPATGTTSLHTAGGSERAPIWLKLERRGSAVTAFKSADGRSWSMIGSQTLTLGSSFYVGLAVTAHSTTGAATATFSNVSAAAPAGGSAPLTPPTVSLTSPAAGATFAAGVNVTIAASASDSDDGVAQVEFYANGTRLGTDTSSPYAYTWSSIPAGSYSLTAVARDTRGAVATSAARSITVTAAGGGSNTPPTVSLSAPAAGTSYPAPASITISATAADANGSVAGVDFYANGTLVGSDTTSPYSVTWTSVAAGSYSLTAVARDNAGAATTSAARSITVADGTTMPRRAVFTPSPDHSTVTYRLDIYTAGANPASATPMATQSLGRPSVVSGECTADIASLISGLPGGSYFATIVALRSGEISPRTTSATFTR